MVQAILNNDTDICHISKIINAMKTKLRHLAGKAFLSLILIDSHFSTKSDIEWGF